MKISSVCIIIYTYFFSVGSVSSEPCTLKLIVTNYKEGLTLYKKQKYQRALTRWLPLAEAGLGPAQRQIALMYATGTGLKRSIRQARFWARLGLQGGDLASLHLDNSLGVNLSPEFRSLLMSRVDKWIAKSIVCSGGTVTATPELKNIKYKVTKDERISSKNSRLIDKNLGLILKIASGKNMINNLYLSIIDQFDFYNGSRYDRYVGWKPLNKLKDENLNVVQLSVSNFHDIKPDYFAKALLFTVKRRIFNSFPNSKLLDPFMRKIKGKRVFGSFYPDVRNGDYFKMMRQAFTMTEQLPKSLRRYINIIDEIHYNPNSKYYQRSGTIDAKGAFYIKSLSSEENRMMFVRRNVLFSSPLFFLQTFIHEGTHAIQDQKASKNLQEVKATRGVISQLQSTGSNLKKISDLQRKNKIKLDYANRWYKGVKTKGGRVQDISFECEATKNEIKSVRIVGALPDIMKGSGYLKLCPEAQLQIIQWRDEISRLNSKNIN
jgi:hypothetical protein